MSRSSNASSSETHDYPVDFDDYTLEVTDALSSTLDYSGELDSPPLDVDEYFVLETGRARLNGGGDDSERDADSQSSAEEEDAMDEKLGRLVENDDACRTFDMPVSVDFSFFCQRLTRSVRSRRLFLLRQNPSSSPFPPSPNFVTSSTPSPSSCWKVRSLFNHCGGHGL